MKFFPFKIWPLRIAHLMALGLTVFLGGLLACAPTALIGLKPQGLQEVPLKIVWLQIPGLSEDHFAFLRFQNLSAATVTSFEESTCWGKLWNFNLFHLRPPAEQGLLAQVTGSTNQQSTCQDYQARPVWSYLKELGFHSGILEVAVRPEQSLAAAQHCPEQKDFLTGTALWRMAKAPTSKTGQFHYQDRPFHWQEGILYDRSCQQTTCFASPVDNFWYLQSQLSTFPSYLLLVRDFSYQNALQAKKFHQAQTILADWEKVYASLMAMKAQDPSILVILSSTSAIGLEFPPEGPAWNVLKTQDQPISYHRPLLTSLALAAGASAENFCGIYQEANLLERILWPHNQKRVNQEIKKINKLKAQQAKEQAAASERSSQ